MSGKLAAEIKQTRPFGSPEEEALLNVLKTAALFDHAEAEALKPYGLSPTQYNALRILKGAGRKGLACQEIAERMIARDPDITRLLDRLEKGGLVTRERSTEDRRVVITRISPKGIKVLESLHRAIQGLPGRLLGHVDRKRLETLIEILEESRERP